MLYINELAKAYSGYDLNKLNIYCAATYLNFLSEIGEAFNGNVSDRQLNRREQLQNMIIKLTEV